MRSSFATNFLLLIFTFRFSKAWTNNKRALSSFRASLFPLHMQIDTEEREDRLSLTSSRRKWMRGITSSVTATIAGSALSTPASNAADLITTNSVCDPSVSVWKYKDRIIYLLGSAHISSQSAETAGQLVRDIHPDAVFVELDLKRVGGSSSVGKKMTTSLASEDVDGSSIAILPGRRTSASSPESLLSSRITTEDTQKSVSMALPEAATSIAQQTPQQQPQKNMNGGMMALGAKIVGEGIRGMYKNLDSAGFNAGGEFIAAVEEGRKEGSAIVLGDRDVDITLSRLAMALRETDLKVLADPDNELEQSMKQLMPSADAQKALAGDTSYKEELSDFVETMKAKENVRLVMSQLKKLAPKLYEVMVAERDAFMAAGLNALNGFECIVAVMGIAHVDGVEENLKSNGWKELKLRCPAVV